MTIHVHVMLTHLTFKQTEEFEELNGNEIHFCLYYVYVCLSSDSFIMFPHRGVEAEGAEGEEGEEAPIE